MQRRDFCKLLSAPMMANAAATPERPNILYILADDLGWGDLGCYNRKSAVPTPNMDRLASNGIRFTDMHSPSAVCTPTRYGILTGRYCWRTHLKKGVLNGYSPNLIEPGRITLGSMLKSNGYTAAGVGKWHLGLREEEKTDFSRPLHPGPVDHGFDSYFGIPASLDMAPYVYFENDHVVEPPTGNTDGKREPRGVFWRPGPMSPGFKIEQVLPTITNKAVDYIRAPHTKPWFLYVALSGPHTPWLPLEKYKGKSQAGIYGDFVAMVDDMLGRILDAVGDTNTLVIFTSDNGADWKIEDKAIYAHRANADWRGEKADIWDGGHRIPFLARWPGKIAPGTVSGQLGCLTDAMATLAALTGVTLSHDSGEDSYNLLPAFIGQATKPIRNAIVHHSVDGMFSIREGRWKLALGLGSGGFTPPARIEPKPDGPAGQLFDLEADPGEQTNLYQRYPEIVTRLTALLEKYRKQGRSRPV